MHLPKAFTLVLSASTAFAAMMPELAERDVKTITAVVTDVGGRLKELTTAINGFNGNPADLLTASTNMLNSLNKGVTDVEGTTPITLNEAVPLQASVTSLQNDGKALIKALADKKPTFESAGLCEVVFKQAGDMGAAATKLIDAVVGKIPKEVQPLAKQLAGGFADDLKKSQQSFASGSCKTAGAAGGSGSGGSGSGGSGSGGSGSGGSGSGGSSSSTPTSGNVNSSPTMPVVAGAGAIAAPLALCIAAVGLVI